MTKRLGIIIKEHAKLSAVHNRLHREKAWNWIVVNEEIVWIAVMILGAIVALFFGWLFATYY